MKVLDPGHMYELDSLDKGEPVQLIFVKRFGSKFPGNENHYSGTNCQEVLRTLIDLVGYLDKQIPCEENKVIIASLREALIQFELRALRRHGDIELAETCKHCGHIVCEELRK